MDNNSLAGDKARESVKENKEATKALVREAMGENLASQLTNGLVNFVGDTGDLGMAGGDLVLDAAMALVSCATGDSYCDTATSDLNKKDQAVGKVLESLFNGEAGEEIKNTVVKASQGDQRALENLAGILTGIVVPAKVLSPGRKTGSMAEQASSKETGSLVEAEKEALERIGQNAKNSSDLSVKPSGSVLQQQAVKKLMILPLNLIIQQYIRRTSS